MRLSLRSAILLGCGLAALQSGTAWASDPLMPEGATAPVKGRELLLPPMINNAPPGAKITLPPPGQEHQFGARPADEQALVVPASSDLPPVQQAEKGVAPKRKPKKARKVEPAAVAAVPAAPDKAVLVGVQKTAVPDQSLVVQEEGAKTQIVEANGRLTDPPRDGMGGPELSGPPKPKDGMRAEPIRDGDKLTRRQARALAAPDVATPKPAASAPLQKVPAIERLQLASASSAPMPVVAADKSAARIPSLAPAWRVALSATSGFGTLEGGQQTYLGGVRADDGDDVLTYEAAAKINLTGLVEPLGGGNVEPYLRLAISGRDGDVSSTTAAFAPAIGPLVIPTTTGGALNLVGGAAANARHRGNKDQVRISAIYGQTWRARGFDVSGFAGVAHAWADHDQSFRFVATGNPGGGFDTFTGAYDTDLRVNTTSFVLGAGVAVPLTGDGKLKADANVRASYDIVQGKGRDALRLAVQATDATVHLSAIDMRRTEDSVGFGAGLGLSYAITNDINLRAGVDFTSHENSPVIVRDAVNASRIEFDREEVLTGTLSASITF